MAKYFPEYVSKTASFPFKFARKQLMRPLHDGMDYESHHQVNALNILETIRKVVASYIFTVKKEKAFA